MPAQPSPAQPTPGQPPSDPPPRALIVDWGGVLTTSLDECMPAWADRDRVDFARFTAMMQAWAEEDPAGPAGVHPIHALERGEMRIADFERTLAARLRTLDGAPVPAAGLLARMFASFEHAPDMAGVVRRARASGLRTALLSNSWGNDYPRDDWDELFDAVVISGEVGMRKPEPRIFQHTLDLIGCAPAEAVFVDDLPANVRGAVEVGMVGVLHRSYQETLGELEALFGPFLGPR